MNSKFAINLLIQLIETPSFSGKEEGVSDIIINHLLRGDVIVKTLKNNVIATHQSFTEEKPTLLLNSHLDTVKPKGDWKTDPFSAVQDDTKIVGLGSNDAGASLVTLLSTFLNFCDKDLSFNLMFVASAEEESSGLDGMPLIVEQYPNIDFAIVGEPTGLNLAIAEKGLMVLDCKATGKAGHAARDEGKNSIYIALDDIQFIKEYRFPLSSQLLGDVKMSVTAIHAGEQHNVVPDICSFLIDIRSTDIYSNETIYDLLKSNLKSEILPRSMRLNPSSLPKNHVMYALAKRLNLNPYGSPTMSDQSVMPWPSVKIGPGESARSHTANEFILIEEIESALIVYSDIIKELSHETLG